jgi:hypothetical protein
VCALHGLGGVGKTAQAAQVCHLPEVRAHWHRTTSRPGEMVLLRTVAPPPDDAVTAAVTRRQRLSQLPVAAGATAAMGRYDA